MANLTAAREDFRKDDELVAYPVKTGVTIYKGALVGVDSTGYAKPAAQGDVRVVGVAYETVAAGAAASGTFTVRAWRRGSFQFNASGMAITNVGAKVYVTDDNTVQTSSTSTIQVGVITEFISATSVRVALTTNV
jgi:predicted RecA/RadA family phage recombinase